MGDSGVAAADAVADDKMANDELQCTICMTSKFNQECRVNGCNHSYCFSCISEWVCQSLRPSCPMCRQEVDKISYDFSKHDNGRMEIGIKECRSGHLQLTPGDRANLLSERRIVVRNIMSVYKKTNEVSNAIIEQNEASNIDEELKKNLVHLSSILTQHLEKAEIMLTNLRCESTRKTKAHVFNTPTFRRIIYNAKIRMKILDPKKQKPKEWIWDPERYRRVVNEFLIAEMDAIPLNEQPTIGDVKWRTKFYGLEHESSEKQSLATQIFDLLVTSRRGTISLQAKLCAVTGAPPPISDFQNNVTNLMTEVCPTFVGILCDHLEAIIAVEKSNLDDFYNEIHYDSVYNNFSSGYMDLSGMLAMRDEHPGQLEALYHQLQHDWTEPYRELRLIRQMSNTDRTDRATNNDDDDISSRSDSPIDRVPTPMPEDLYYEMQVPVMRDFYHRALNRPLPSNQFPFRVESPPAQPPREPRQPISQVDPRVEGVTTRTLPRLRTLRPSDRRHRDIAEHTSFVSSSRPETRRDDRGDGLSTRVRELGTRSEALSSLFFPRSAVGEPTDGRRRIASPPNPPSAELALRGADSSSSWIPRYQPQNAEPRARSRPNYPTYLTTNEAPEFSLPSTSAYVPPPTVLTHSSGRPMFTVFMETLRGRPVPPSPPPPRREDDISIDDIIAQINQEDADNGLDFVSVAHRTRSARRAAANGDYPGAPPAKRPANNPE